MIDINNIVDVDFKIIKEESTIGSYNTVVYLIKDTMYKKTESTPEAKNNAKLRSAVATTNYEEVKAVLCDSLESLDNIYCKKVVEGKPEEYVKLPGFIVTSIKQFFYNDGKKLLLVTASKDSTGYNEITFKNDIETAKRYTKDFIYVCISNILCNVDNSNNGYTNNGLQSIVKYVEDLKSPYTIRLLLTAHKDSNKTIEQSLEDYGYENFNKNSVGIKYCSKYYNDGYIDASLLIGAYFTNIDLNEPESIKDYCYTPEKMIGTNTETGEDVIIDPSENITNDDYEYLTENNYNFIDSIGTNVVNFGGNLKNGISLSVDFATVCLENDVCNATLNEMMKKQYLNEAGLTNIVSTIHKCMQRYKDNGYIKTNSYYSGNKLEIRYNGKNYKLINKGDVLIDGYLVYAIPVSNISLVDKENKKFPPIYVIIESLAGARVISIRGEVR